MQSEWVVRVINWAESQSDKSIERDLKLFKSSNVEVSEKAYKRLRHKYGKAQSDKLDQYISSRRVGTKNRLQDALLDPIEPYVSKSKVNKDINTSKTYYKVRKSNKFTKSNKVSNSKIIKSHINSRLLKFTSSGSIGSLIGLSSIIGLKSRLRSKYPDKSEIELDSMVYEIAVKRGIAGYLVGLVLCGMYERIKSKLK